jgi:outer membrane protein assembly factor BamB
MRAFSSCCVAVWFLSCATSGHGGKDEANPPYGQPGHHHHFGFGAPADPAKVEAPLPPPEPIVATPVDPGDGGAPVAPRPITARKLWSVKLAGVGTSSPRVVDLDGDGVLDVVVGGGMQTSGGSWLYAVNGLTGAVLWKSHFAEEFYATPVLIDVTRDGVPDVFVGGRDADFTALDGKTGKKLWSLRRANPKGDVPNRSFNGGLAVPDQDSDGVDDLVVTNGGGLDDTARLPGRVMLISAATGKLLANTALPDKRETYSIPALVSAHPLEVLAGTGGETLNGHLYRLPLGKAPVAPKWEAASGPTQGFVPSPFITQVKGTSAVFEVGHDGRVIRLDLESGALKWEQSLAGFEAMASPSPGRFGGSADVDVVVTRSKGTFPLFKWVNRITWLDGETGAVLDEADTGVFSSASPVVVDFDRDGLDETLTLSMDSFAPFEGSVVSTVTVFDGARGKQKRMQLKLRGTGQATPLVADVDHDGTLDLVISYLGTVDRYALELPDAGAPPEVRWGGFRGPTFDGVDHGAGDAGSP